MRSRFVVLVGAMAVTLAGVASPAGGSPGRQGDSSDQAGRYVVLMAADPVAAYDGGVRGLRATTPGPGERVKPRSTAVQRYVGHLERRHHETLVGAGAEQGDVSAEYSYSLNGFAAELTRAEVEAMTRQPGVVAVLKDRVRQPQTDNSPSFLGLDARNGPWDSDLVGEGVVMGVIDTGIWPEHPSFADDGTFPEPAQPFRVPCRFGDTAHNPDDEPFECNNKLLGARDMRQTYKQVIGPETYNSARDEEGHGTHTASTAAGNADVEAEIFGIPRGDVSGIAPRAQVIAYKACGLQGCFSSDLAAAVDRAVADGVDVINYSIGGGASLTSPDGIAFLFAADAGVFVATSAGNAGPGAGTVGGPSTVPWVTSVGASTQDRAFEGTVTLGSGRQLSGASITGGSAERPLVDAAALGNELCLVGQGFGAPVRNKVVLCQRGQNARVDKSLAVSRAGGAGMVLYDVADAAALVTDNHWVPSVHINNTDGLAMKRYIARVGDRATAQIAGGERVRAEGSVMADFSSRGPNPVAADIIKPDVTAPGVNILAGNTPTSALGRPGQLFQSISGTSMSSPHVAGIYAMLKQAHPRWSPARAKSALMTTARQDVVTEDGTTQADPFDFGAGHVRPGGRVDEGSLFQPGLVYDAGLNDYLAFLCGTEPSIFVDPVATCRDLRRAGFSTDPANLNYPSIGVAKVAGTRTVNRRVTSVTAGAGSSTFTAEVDPPPGFEVTVSPEEVTLRRGETATYQVTFSNDGSAVIGRWAFGSLTWTDGSGDIEVRSPIAVAASEFRSPDQVTGTGRAGSAAFRVRFGYTGPYSARAHGLVARRNTPGTVAQDPDQTFDPNNPAGTTAHVFRVGRAAYVRWRLTHPEPTVDLDLYLYDRAGRQVASSTSGGTDELIELRLPPRRRYTLYVHGWQTAGARRSYRLGSWRVPSAPGDSLRVARAPSAAVIGANGRVRVAWRGLDRGKVYFGAVSHRRGAAAVGLTVTRVGTRR